jgi:leucyl/phenylalanyl-tRNA--protein transferase
MAFRQVITACSEVPREDQNGTWITEEMIEAYCQLHELGVAHSFETYFEDQLVGGCMECR